MRRLALAFGFVLGLLPALAWGQAPPAVAALPDTERRTSYSMSGTTCACSVGFQLYNDGTDVDSQIEVWISGVRYLSTDVSHGWALSSVTGSLATIARPITNAVLTFNAVQTGTVQIVGAERPRRLSQVAENRGVAARDFNQTVTSIIAVLREIWDKINDVTGRGLFSQPGNTLGPLPSPTGCQGAYLGFDGTGLQPICLGVPSGTGNVTGASPTVVGHFARWSNITGTLLADFDLFSANNTFTGNNTFSTGTVNFTGTFKVGGNTMTWPGVAATIPYLAGSQTWTGTNIFSPSGTTTTFKSSGSGASLVAIDSSAASQQTGLNFLENGTLKWILIKQTDLSFVLFDVAGGVSSAIWTPGAAGAGFVTFGYTTDSTSAATGSVVVNGGLGVAKSVTVGGQLRTTFGTPAIASGACGTGTNGVITSGNNQAGLVTIGSGSTTTCQINFSVTLGTSPNACNITPANAAAAATGTTVARVSAVNATGFVITGTALANAAYYFICI